MSITQKILIGEDRPQLLKGLHKLLVSLDYNRVISCSDGQEALEKIQSEEPDIAILDINLPKICGLQVAEQAQEKGLFPKIILITLYPDQDLFDRAQHLGVVGYVFKQFALVEMKKCLTQVVNGETFISEELRKFLKLKVQGENLMDKLTTSEERILLLIAMNHTTPQIAEQLFISKKTVEKHRSNISKKLGLSGKTNSLLLWAKENIKNMDF